MEEEIFKKKQKRSGGDEYKFYKYSLLRYLSFSFFYMEASVVRRKVFPHISPWSHSKFFNLEGRNIEKTAVVKSIFEKKIVFHTIHLRPILDNTRALKR